MADEYLTAALYGMKRFSEGASKKVKELMGMEKLIELLNEFETPHSGIVFKSYDDYDGTFYGVDIDGETEIAWSDSLICSKKFGWIGWLVENDKIDFEGMSGHANIIKYLRDVKKCNRNQIKEGVVIMLLSISDTPIEDLISYLK